MASPFSFGKEFLVNTTTEGSQSLSSVTGLADGRFVVTWQDYSQTGGDTSGHAVRAQVFNANGSFSGSEFLVNTTTNDFQGGPSVTALDDGRFVISWGDLSETGGDTSGNAVRAQVFTVNGTPSGPEFLVNTVTLAGQGGSLITALTDDRFIITWTDYSQTGGDPSSSAVRAQVFNGDGTPSGAEFLVTTLTPIGYKTVSSVTGLTDGGFVVTWGQSYQAGGDPFGKTVRAQVFNSDGTPSGGQLLGNDKIRNYQAGPEVTGLAGGRFVVSWIDYEPSGSDLLISAIRAQIFNRNGTPSGPEIHLETPITKSQSEPTVTALSDGRFVVAWTGENLTDHGHTQCAIRAQVINIDGSLAGDEFRVSVIREWARYPSISALADGRFIVYWAGYNVTGDDTSWQSVHGRIIDPRDAAVTLNGSLLDDDFVGTRYSDQMSGFIGNDTLSGRGGDDNLFGEQGNDTLFGNAGNDRIYGGSGDDTLRGGSGADQLYGGAGDDLLIGGFGIDYMKGGSGDDTYVVNQIGDMVVEKAGKGTDWVRSATLDLDLANYANVENLMLKGAQDLNLTGNAKDNVLIGNSGDNVVIGGGGDDTLNGRAGDDRLTGGAGRDTLTGGSGADSFVFNATSETGTTLATRDTIKDFSQTDSDLIDLSAIDAGAAAPADQAFAFIGASAFTSTETQLRYFQTASKTIIQGDTDGDGVADFEIRLNGLIDLTAGDFIL